MALTAPLAPPAPLQKFAGRVLTPSPLAEALCAWAIRSPGDRVLDLGVGEGAFALAAINRLRSVGADDTFVALQVHGAEWDAATFAVAQGNAKAQLGMELPNVVCADFYDVPIPPVDVVVGNPPYIRRHYQQRPDRYREASGIQASTGLTDAYCFFVTRACRALRPGGRLAVLVSSSWLDMKYGQELKRLLLEQFRIQLVLGFEGRVFEDAAVKPVVLLAEKSGSTKTVTFARLSDAAPLSAVAELLEAGDAEPRHAHLAVTKAERADVPPDRPWSPYLRAPNVYRALGQALPLVRLGAVADTRIGLQTFAKPFFILGRAQAAAAGIEAEFLLPIAFSPRSERCPVIDDATRTEHVIFACDRPLESLSGTQAFAYIRRAMTQVVQVRGKNEQVLGYHRAPRLVRARRNPWYNVRSSIERRGVWPMLLPRRVYENYLVIHNRAGVVANEDFIELLPRGGEGVVAPLLAFMNSDLGEILVRSHAFQYGGGVFNLNPGAVADIPVLDLCRLSRHQQHQLAAAWQQFARSRGAGGDRMALDEAVAQTLALPTQLIQEVKESRQLHRGLAKSSKRLH